MIDKYFNEIYHLPKSGEDFPVLLCKNWQSDNCILGGGAQCPKFHRCRYCGGKHPGDLCRKRD